MTVEKINIKGNWMIKTLLGFVFALFASFGFLISSNGRVAAQELGDCHMHNGDVFESISYHDCAGAGGSWLSGAGSDGASGGFEKYEETGFGSISFNYDARVEESWSKGVRRAQFPSWTEHFSGSYVYYISGSASVYLEKKPYYFLGPLDKSPFIKKVRKHTKRRTLSVIIEIIRKEIVLLISLIQILVKVFTTLCILMSTTDLIKRCTN